MFPFITVTPFTLRYISDKKKKLSSHIKNQSLCNLNTHATNQIRFLFQNGNKFKMSPSSVFSFSFRQGAVLRYLRLCRLQGKIPASARLVNLILQSLKTCKLIIIFNWYVYLLIIIIFTLFFFYVSWVGQVVDLKRYIYSF